MSAPRKLTVDFWFDLVCPWCWIGLRQLKGAQQRLRASAPDLELEVRYQSFPLLPHLPREGLPYLEFYLRRLGGPAALAHRRAQIQAAGQGIIPPLAFDRITTMPNTLLGHRMLQFVQAHASDAIPALLEDVFAAWFTEGRDIGNAAVLAALAAPHVPDPAALEAWLADDAGWQSALHAALQPGRAEVGGVPCLTTTGQPPLSGVTGTDYLHFWLTQAARAAA
ncbi:DsbA family protein [Pseudoduganella sp. OTU4001]|uniref:DsbA family protein n=1 Tax=Pseudoduganella sp. OTU4001 TaxID=3043854 RepID=UPI00313C7EE2